MNQEEESYPTITEKIPDDALVVRGGRNRPEYIRRGTGTHPNGQIGVTTVGEVRQAGGDVIRTSGRSPYHATLTGLTPEQASQLLRPTIPNPG